MSRIRKLTGRLALLLGVLLGALGSAPATAKIIPGFEGSIRSICLDSTTKAHPKKDSLEVVLPDERFAAPGSAQIMLVYEPESFNSGSKGKLSAKATLIKSDGTETKLGTLNGKQATANGPIQVVKPIDVGLGPGNRIVVDVKFSKFDKLRGKECFTVFAVVAPAE